MMLLALPAPLAHKQTTNVAANSSLHLPRQRANARVLKHESNQVLAK
jgi:hypothetical protein